MRSNLRDPSALRPAPGPLPPPPLPPWRGDRGRLTPVPASPSPPPCGRRGARGRLVFVAALVGCWLLLQAPSPAQAAGPLWLQVVELSTADHERVPGELLLRLDGAPVGVVPALLALTPAPPTDPHHLELARADGAYAFLLKLAVDAERRAVRVLSAETQACPQVQLTATVTGSGPPQLRLTFLRGAGPPCKGEGSRTPAGDERYRVRFDASVTAAQVYYPQVRGFLDRLLQRQVYDFVRQGPAPLTLVVPYEPKDVAVIFKAPQRPDCVLRLHMEGPRYGDVTLVAGSQRLPAVPAGASQPPQQLTCTFAAGPP